MLYAIKTLFMLLSFYPGVKTASVFCEIDDKITHSKRKIIEMYSRVVTILAES